MIWKGTGSTCPHVIFSTTDQHSEINTMEVFHLEIHCGKINIPHLASFLLAQRRTPRKGIPEEVTVAGGAAKKDSSL